MILDVAAHGHVALFFKGVAAVVEAGDRGHAVSRGRAVLVFRFVRIDVGEEDVILGYVHVLGIGEVGRRSAQIERAFVELHRDGVAPAGEGLGGGNALARDAVRTLTLVDLGQEGALLAEIMEYLRFENHPNLFLHANGLLYTNGHDRAVTWMNSTANGRPVTPRTGYVVEINALWYNALCFVADLLGENALTDALKDIAAKTAVAFKDTFLNEHGYLLDYVDGHMMDWSVRPNMIFTAAFDYSPLNNRQKKGIVDICSKELLTPKGLRSLSPKSGGYNPNYVGPQIQRDYAYHQGTAWPWLAGFYFEAYLKIYKMSALGFIERHLIGFEDEMTSHCIASIPELFDGNPPFKGRGAVSFAMNVAEILRTLNLLSKYNY